MFTSFDPEMAASAKRIADESFRHLLGEGAVIAGLPIAAAGVQADAWRVKLKNMADAKKLRKIENRQKQLYRDLAIAGGTGYAVGAGTGLYLQNRPKEPASGEFVSPLLIAAGAAALPLVGKSLLTAAIGNNWQNRVNAAQTKQKIQDYARTAGSRRGALLKTGLAGAALGVGGGLLLQKNLDRSEYSYMTNLLEF